MHVFLDMQENEQNSVDLWVRLARAHNKILDAVNKALKASELPDLSWYDVLLEVERSGREGLRPFELEERMLLPQYSVSRLVDRIAKAGLIAVKPLAEDGRGKQLIITKEGKKVRLKMWRVYGPALKSAISEKLTSAQIKEAQQLLSHISGS